MCKECIPLTEQKKTSFFTADFRLGYIIAFCFAFSAMMMFNVEMFIDKLAWFASYLFFALIIVHGPRSWFQRWFFRGRI